MVERRRERERWPVCESWRGLASMMRTCFIIRVEMMARTDVGSLSRRGIKNENED